MSTSVPRPRLRPKVPGTWAFDTMSRKIRSNILARVFRKNDDLPLEALRKLQLLDLEFTDAAHMKLI